MACFKGKKTSDDPVPSSPASADDEDFSVEVRKFAPEHLLIKFENFSSLTHNGREKYESRAFVAGDHKWKLSIYPMVPDPRFLLSENVSVYLSSVETSGLPVDWEVNAIFSVFLFNQIQDNYVCFRGKKVFRFHAMNPEWGFSKLMSYNSLTRPSNGYVVREKCVFGAEVLVIKSPRVIEHVSFREGPMYMHDFVISNLSTLRDVWNSEEFTAGDHRWKVQFFPNGFGSASGYYVSVYLKYISVALNAKVMANIVLTIKSKDPAIDRAHSRKLCEWFSSSSESLVGIPEFMPIALLQDPVKGFVVDDCCCLELGISVVAVVSDAPN